MATGSFDRSSDGTVLTLAHNRSPNDLGGSPFSDIVFNFTDTNENYTPQARIRARNGLYGGDPNTLEKEGSGQLEFYTATGTSGTEANDTCKLLIGNDGKVGINNGTTEPANTLYVNGSFYASGSSRDYKEDITNYNPDTSNIDSLRPVEYNYKEEWAHMGDNTPVDKQVGLIAEEVAEIYPELTLTNRELDPNSPTDNAWVVRNVNYQKLSILLLKEVQNLRSRLDALEE